ncbi:hypothetical protein [Mycolicibacterium sp. 624]
MFWSPSFSNTEAHQTGLGEETDVSLLAWFVAGALVWGALTYVVPP